MLITVTMITAAAILASLAIVMAYVLGWAKRTFHVEVDPKVEKVVEALCGVNCGGCGYVGCVEYAEAVVRGEADVSLCAPGGGACAQALAQIVGVELSESFPYRAVVHCAAHWKQRLERAAYNGEPTCAAANLVAGVQGCTYGCLGMGDCTRACNYDALHVIDGLATIDYEKCIGCKACAKACPRNIISMVPFKAERMLVVACSNQDAGPDVKAVCSVGCIGCKACSRNAELMDMVGNLPVIDYDRYGDLDEFAAARQKCPRESMIEVGKPSPADLAAVADEEMPERIEADFKTTVDETEWWG
jgi:RnfABCDGE-type electron transport complex B subunit